MKLKTYFSVIKELLTCSHCLIYMECIIACCLNCFERSSICILNLSLLGCVQLRAVLSHAIMHVCCVQSAFLFSGGACDCKYCFEHHSSCCSEQSSVWAPRQSSAVAICKGLEHNKNIFSLAFSCQTTALMYWSEKKTSTKLIS